MKFSKQDTNIAKTVAIVMMYIHHLFYSKETYAGYLFSFAPLSEAQTLVLAQCCKVCVAVFVFLSAYGITLSFRKREKEFGETWRILYVDDFCRYIKLIFGFWFIYILAQCTSFLGRSNVEVYGTGVRRVIHTIIDVFGMSSICQTPTFNPTWWYMGLAIAMLLLMPLLYRAQKKLNVVIPLLIVIIPRMLSLEFTNLRRYVLVMCVGILFAEGDLFARIHNAKIVNRGGYFCKLTICVILFCGFYYVRYKTGYFLDIIDSSMAVIIIYFFFELFYGKGESIKNIMGFIGKYSMNMFLAHSFFLFFYFKHFFYSFQNAWLILFVLIVVTLAFSVLVEFVKKESGFCRFVDRVNQRIRQRL